MRYETTFLGKTIFKECYVTDRSIKLVDLDWIDELNLIHSLAPEQLVIADVVQRRDRKDQDIIPHVPPGLDGISLVSRSISRRRRTGDQIYERACYT
ncbi:unnamed protein product [Hymenolepis diminuta]|uniref:Transposase n=1 Tax=Hymenolepis diminuta TaxID=6216 RepID=A0A0R3SWA2_HYMDI|nr:unnamed protein product [Hymenolepis diminuta]